MAKLHFKYGAMNSGKSDTLIKTAFNYTEQGLYVATIKPTADTKSEQFIVARGGASRLVDIMASPDTDLRQAVELFIGRQALACVLVDEAQFLSGPQIDQLFNIAKIDDVSVIAYGLRTDFRTQLFAGSKRLLELADNIEKIPTMCGCGSQAEFNCRKQGDRFIFVGEQVAIDGKEATTYKSMCGKCYDREKADSLA
ncbi:MAG: thymidine kinase [Candidatus Saccharibacteria bacterium]